MYFIGKEPKDRILVSNERVMAKLRSECKKSLVVLRPLRESLRWTDGVIDQVVYRLYGLTEEEVRVVVGRHDNCFDCL